MNNHFDVLVVGSGASGANAAVPLVAAGLSVCMLDVGNVDAHYAPLIPNAPFSELRSEDTQQHRYFLGDAFEGVPFGSVRVGAQLTPPRQFIKRDTDRLTPLATKDFGAMESLALGGLAAGWGAAAVQFDDHDLADFPIKLRDLAPHYDAVARRIGISGAADDLQHYLGVCPSLQPALALDSNGRTISARYEQKRRRLNRAGLYLGRSRLAVLSQALGERQPQQYFDMDFYADKERSVYRPAFTVEALQRESNFTYARPYLVQTFEELPQQDKVEVQALNTEQGSIETFSARRLILAAGTLGTARIVLRSLDRYETPVPLACNPFTYAPCLNLAMLGKASLDKRHSLAQLALVFDPDHSGKNVLYAELHSYRSLMLFKLAKESALAVRDSWRILRDLRDAFVVMSIHHEDRPSPEKHCVLHRAKRGEPDLLEVGYALEPALIRRQTQAEKQLLRLFRKLCCWSFKRIHPGYGASIHYAAPFPMTTEERELTVTPACQLRGTKRIYLADGSVFPYLPAKALTLSLIANADRVATGVLNEFR